MATSNGNQRRCKHKSVASAGYDLFNHTRKNNGQTLESLQSLSAMAMHHESRVTFFFPIKEFRHF